MFQSHFVVTQEMSYRIDRPPCDHLTSSNVIHAPRALKPCSRDLRVITVSDIVMVASKLSAADEHHTASSHEMGNPAFSRSSFQAQAGDNAIIQHLSAKSKSPMYPSPRGSSHFSVWHLAQNAVPGISNAVPNRSAAHGSPCGTYCVRRIPGVVMSSSFTNVSDPHAATDTGGSFRASMASMITWCETWSATSQSITKIGIYHSVACPTMRHRMKTTS